jgi:hypothetical protein
MSDDPTTPSRAPDHGLLAGPLDIDATPSRRRSYKPVVARRGTVVEDRGTGIVGAIVEFGPPRLVVRDRHGRDHALRYADGSVTIAGEPVALRRPRVEAEAPGTTASGSIDIGGVPARIARASRIWVEGVHDAELIEKIWGDDLRIEGVVVERLDGADDLAGAVRRFGPRPGRRLGVLLDHLVDGSKESRLAASVDHPDVLVRGHPYVDVWQAIKPAVIGLERWPDIRRGEPWKDGVLAALAVDVSSGEFWRQLIGRVKTWKDLEPALLGAVEELIDFVAPPPQGDPH